MAVLDDIANNSVWRFPFLHILSKTFHLLPFWSSPFLNVWCYISWWHYVLYLLAFPLCLVLLVEHLIIACWSPVCLLWKNVYSDHLPIFNWILFVLGILNFTCSLYILNIMPLIGHIIYKYIFLLSRLPLVLLMISFIVQKLCKFDVVLLIFAFVVFAWENIPKKVLLIPVSKSLLPMFSSKSFIVSSNFQYILSLLLCMV